MQSRDDHLFEAQRKNRENKKRKLIFTIAGAVLAVIIIVAAGANALKQKVNEQMGDADEVLSAQVTVGNISTTVSGSGTLEAVDVEDYKVPSSVEIVDYYVEAGDDVASVVYEHGACTDE